MATGKVRSFPTYKNDAVTALAFSPDGKAFALFNERLRVSIWDADNGEQWGGYSECDHEVDHVAFMPNGKWVIGASPNAFIKFQVAKKGPRKDSAAAGQIWFQAAARRSPAGRDGKK